jgi:hypothetical protein
MICHVLLAKVRVEWVASFCLACGMYGQSASGESVNSSRAEGQRLLATAVEAEIAGDTAQYLSLLDQAVRSNPDSDLLHWQLGQIRDNGKWMQAEELQHRAASDPIEAEYVKRRNAATGSAASQVELARWCRDNNLADEARLHWNVALSIDPKNKEAQHATDALLKNGRLVKRSAIAEQKELAKKAKDVAKHWDPLVAAWRKDVAGKDVQAHDDALAEIRQIRDVDAIPSFENVTLGRDAFDPKSAETCLQITIAFLGALDQMPRQLATESIARHAVLSPGNKARALAIDELKTRKQANYMPLLLGSLKMPIESTYSVETGADGSVHYAHSLYREGPNADQALDSNYFTNQLLFDGKDYQLQRGSNQLKDVSQAEHAAHLRQIAVVARRSEAAYSLAANRTESSVASANEAARQISERIIPILASVTGKDFETPKQWWNYWQDTNEYYMSEHPVDYRYYSNTDDHIYGHPNDTVTAPHSCFGKGTTVWTKTGMKPIETLQAGDLVLSQNIETGELRYEPVLLRTLRPPGKMMRISSEGGELNATTGHPFWVAGAGWKMTKELGDDAILHCVKGSDRVRSIESTDDADAFNLVVAETNTYFVGSRGILVHDITPRGPTTMIDPGVAEAW